MTSDCSPTIIDRARILEHATDGAATAALHELVATPSVSGDERSAVNQFITVATRLGFCATIDDAGNGIARRTKAIDPARTLCLLGHIDTVPGDIPVRIEGDILRGRGAVDAKGPLMAMLFAAARADLPDTCGVDVIAAVGEETPDSPGAHHLLATYPPPDACIIGEPSGVDGVTLGYKGRLLLHAHCARPNTHTSGPERSAPDTLHAFWSDILDLLAHLNAGVDRIFDQVQASIHDWHSSNDGLTDRAILKAGFRLPPAITPDDLAQRLAALAPNTLTLTFTGHTPAHAADLSDPVVCALRSAIREFAMTPRPKLKTGTADLNVVGPVWRCPIAAYGPGDSALDHTPDEHLHLPEFHRAIAVLQRTIESLARSGPA